MFVFSQKMCISLDDDLRWQPPDLPGCLTPTTARAEADGKGLAGLEESRAPGPTLTQTSTGSSSETKAEPARVPLTQHLYEHKEN